MITALLLTGAVPSFAWSETDGASADTGSSANVLPAISIDQSDAPKIRGKQAIVMDLDTGTVIYEKNADKIIEPASTTKILTALVVLETLDLDQVIEVPENVETEVSVIWLEPGEKMTVEELLYGMMLESGNDAAQVLGLAAGDGDLDRFSEMMNARAEECGATKTDFKNPNGLNEDRSRLNFTTARDLALIAREVMKKDIFREVVSSSKHTIPATNKSGKRKLVNSNVCLWLKSQTTTIKGKEVPFKYKGCNGIKTGFTSDAGFCFVGSAARSGTDFLVVSMGAEDSADRFRDGIILWDYAFSKYETYPVLKAEEPAGVQRVWAGTKRKVEVGTQRDLGVTIDKGTADDQEFTTEFRLTDSKATAPVTKGQKMGQALVFNTKGRLVGAEDLYALASVPEGGPLSKIGIADEDLPMAGCIAGAVLLLIILLLILRARRKRRNRRMKQVSIQNELSSMRTSGTGMTARELTDLTGVEEEMPTPRGPARISNDELNMWTSTAAAEKGKETSETGDKRHGKSSPKKNKDRKDKKGKKKEKKKGKAASHGSAATAGKTGAAGTADRSGRPAGSGAGKAAGSASGFEADLLPGGTARYERFSAPDMPKMNITPRTPFAGSQSPAEGKSAGASRTSFAGSQTTAEGKGAITPRTPFAGGQNPVTEKRESRTPGRQSSLTDEELFSMLESTEVYDRNQPRRHGKLTDTERHEMMEEGRQDKEAVTPNRFSRK